MTTALPTAGQLASSLRRPSALSAQPVASLRGRDFIRLGDFSREELAQLLDLALAMKGGANRERYLEGQNVGMLFTNPSTRTRVSFQVAVSQLGGHAEQFDPEDMHVGVREDLKDTAVVMGRYLDALVVRTFNMQNYGQGRRTMETLAEYSAAPVVNALDDKEHPCQVLADLLTLKERFGPALPRKRVVLTWAYSEREQSLGVPHSMLTAAALFGMNLTIAHPEGYELEDDVVRHARQLAQRSGAELSFCHNLNEAAQDAEVIYTKNWKSLRLTTEEEKRFKEQARHDWCVSADHLRRADPAAVYMDCMPFTRGHQVMAEVADGPQSIIYDQAENRLHVQKAILASLLGR